MIDIRKLKELVRLMVDNELTELDLRDKEEKVTIKRGQDGPIITHAPMGVAHAASASPAPRAEQPESDGAGADNGLVPIESPMVGTFYSSANPDTDPFVGVGAPVSPGQTVCLVEAMKVFNEIKAESGGVIERICVKNGEAVEFGQPLFMVRP